MINAPIPENEVERLKAVKDLAILDTPAEKRFDRITSLATKLFNVPISTITIMDSDREFYKSCQGLDAKEGSRAISFCGHAIASEEETMIIEDTKMDSRFSDNPMVVRPPYIRFYAGVPIYSLTNQKVGVFCIKGTEPRKLSESESFLLKTLASWAELEVNIVSLKKILDQGKNDEKLKELLERLTHRNVVENLESLKFGLKIKKEDISEIESIENMIIKIQKIII